MPTIHIFMAEKIAAARRKSSAARGAARSGGAAASSPSALRVGGSVLGNSTFGRLLSRSRIQAQLVPGTVIQRQELDVTGVTPLATAEGQFYRFDAPAAHTNQSGRPQFQHPRSALQAYSGAGASGTQYVHPAVSGPLNTLMSDLIAEGTRLNDESMKQAVVASAYRPPTASEGEKYLAALRKTISQNPSIFGSLEFPSGLDTMAQSELGFAGSAEHRAFGAALAAEPGWNTRLARRLLEITRDFKAPRGGSTHHSGLVVDINFPYATEEGDVQRHDIKRENNAGALRSAAGVWLAAHAPAHGFDTYSTSSEIWHMEWRNWAGTTADPDYVPPAP